MIEYLSKKHTIDSKGLAIFIIIICHLSALIFPSNIARITTPLGGIGVAIFLFISGYGINESYKEKGLNKYWIKKFINVIIPYIIVFIIYTIINYSKLNIINIIKLFLTIKDTNNYYYWYIGYQIICYTIFYITIKISQTKKIKYILLSIFFSICFILLNEIRAEQAFSFMLGIIVSDSKNIKEKIKKQKTTILFLIVGIVTLSLKQIDLIRTLPDILFKFIQLMIKLPIGIAIINIIYKIINIKYNKTIEKILNLIGKYSYEIFLSHGIAVLVFEHSKNNKLNIILFILITLIGTYILNKITNKIKYKKGSKK